MKTLEVKVSPSYPVHIGFGLSEQLEELILKYAEADRYLFITDQKVFSYYGEWLKGLFPDRKKKIYVIPEGEASKCLAIYEELLESMAQIPMTRKDCIVAFGGGVVGDLSGFLAATYLRGINWIQVPTTLLAAVDSSVGGKTGVNLKAGKNLVGAFYQPKAVLCDPGFFKTLDPEVRREGFAEVIKTACLGLPELWEVLEKGGPFDDEILLDVILLSVSKKAEVVAADEKEAGLRKILNLGHTYAHGIEELSQHKIRHGQAVAMGLAAISKAAVQEGYLSLEDCRKILRMLKKYGFSTSVPFSAKDLFQYASRDKKRSGDKVTLIVPVSTLEVQPVEVDMEGLLKWLEAGL